MTSTEIAKTMLEAIKKFPIDKCVGIAQTPSWKLATAAKALGIHQMTLRGYVRERIGIPYFQKKPNSTIYFPIRELIEWDSKKA